MTGQWGGNSCGSSLTNGVVPQPGVPHGGGRGGVRGATQSARLLLLEAVQDGGVEQEATQLPRGREQHLPQLGDAAFPASDLPEGAVRQDGELAHAGAG